MIIKFIKDENNRFKVTEPEELKGQLLPIGFLTNRKHYISSNGEWGEIQVQISILAGGPGQGEVNIIGIKEESWEQTKLREARESVTGPVKGARSPAIHAAVMGPSQEWVDQPEGFQLFTEEESKEVLPVEDLTNDDEVFPEDVEMESLPSLLDSSWCEGSDGYADTPDSRIAASHSVVFRQPLPTSPTKPWEPDADGCVWGAAALLNVLGFVPRPNKNGSIHRWYHPVLGDDKAENHLLFDLETDSMEMLAVKIFRLGAKLGTRALKYQIINTLEQH